MPSSQDEELVTFDRNVADVQKVASAALCLVALGMVVYTAINGIWLLTATFFVGLALAVQSYRVARENGPSIEEITS